MDITSKGTLRAKPLTFNSSWYTSSLPTFNRRSSGDSSVVFQVPTALCSVYVC